uniref:SWIM-type domain-containing protein n=1 Tax=Setaria italica TaxID=4555 RepID=K3ZM91_SETIT
FRHYRPVFSIDGTFFIGKYRGTLLIAISCDANNMLVPLAFALVERENNDSWGWFLRLVRIHAVGPGKEVGVIFDRHQGILHAVQEQIEGYPPLHHRWCTQHLRHLSIANERASTHEVQYFDLGIGTYQVEHRGGTTSDGEIRESRIHVVVLRDFKCTCGRPRQYHFICSHLVAAARHRNFDIESMIPHDFSVDTLVRTWSPRFVPFRDPREWPPYDGPKYVADPAYRWNKRGTRKRTRHNMTMDQVSGRTRHGRATPFLTDPEQNECSKCGRLGHNSHTCHWQISEVLPLLRSRAHDGFLALQYDDRYTPLLEMAGLDVISYQVRRGMPKFNSAAITALVDRWRPETHSFHLPFGEMTMTLQKMLGLSIRSWAVTGPCVSEGWRARVTAFLGREDADAETVGHYCRAWILHLFACVLFPDSIGDTTSWMWIHCLTDWQQAGHYSWGSTVLCFLYRQLCEACRRTSGSASVGELPRRQPTWAYLWYHVKVSHTRLDHAYLDYINELDALTAHSVNWQTYEGEDALPFTVSFMCAADDDLYRMKCPLICFYAIEYHLPDRVTRQFGIRQIWPTPTTSTSVESHSMDRKKKRKVSEWPAFHQAYIEEWEHFHDNVDENDEPHTNSEYRQYQTWYQGATRHRLRVQWTQDDYADIHSSDDEDTSFSDLVCK